MPTHLVVDIANGTRNPNVRTFNPLRSPIGANAAKAPKYW